MKFPVNVAEAVAGDVSVNFCRGNGSVAQEFLNDAKVGAIFEQVSRKAVPQHVRRDISVDSGTTNALFDAKPKSNRGEGCAALGEKDISR